MSLPIHWQCSTFDQLQPRQLYAILQSRSEVFVLEQNCLYQDMDGKDPHCQHLAAWDDEQQLLAYLRIVPPGLSYPEASLGRVITTARARGRGLGKELLQRGIQACQTAYPNTPLRIGAQQYLETFYASFGFVTVSAMYLEDGIPHIEMLLGDASAQK